MGRRQRQPRAPSPAPRPEPEELDLEAFSRSLHPAGLCIRDVSNDGNCFFRAVSDQLYGSEEYHMKLRERACDYLQAHRAHYRHFVDDEQSFDDYVAEMRTDGVWADNLELQAISMAYYVNIRVHQSGNPSYDIRNHAAKNARVIHLSYHFGEHYASVRPLRTAELSVPAQHDPLPPSRSSASASPRDASPDRAARRPRQPPRPQEDDTVSAVWRRADRGHCDVCDLVERTRRAARAVRTSENTVHASEHRKDAARKVERDMRDARSKLLDIGKAIDEGKHAHRFRSKKIVHEPRDADTQLSDSDAASSYSEDDGREEEEYTKAVRHETDVIFARLNDIENAVRAATEKVAALTIENADEASDAQRPNRGSKKREQEAKRRERKERRRREQERIARGDADEAAPPPFNGPNELDIAI